jgi:hypothetical protein
MPYQQKSQNEPEERAERVIPKYYAAVNSVLFIIIILSFLLATSGLISVVKAVNGAGMAQLIVGGLAAAIAFLTLIVRVSNVQPLDAGTGHDAAKWTDDWVDEVPTRVTSMGMWLEGTEGQFESLQALVNLSMYLDTSVSPGRLSIEKRTEFWQRLEACKAMSETQPEVITRYLPTFVGDQRRLLVTVLNSLRKLAGVASAPRVGKQELPQLTASGEKSGPILVELHVTAIQCERALSTLEALFEDSETLLRASDIDNETLKQELVRPVERLDNETSRVELVRASNGEEEK